MAIYISLFASSILPRLSIILAMCWWLFVSRIPLRADLAGRFELCLKTAAINCSTPSPVASDAPYLSTPLNGCDRAKGNQ